MQTRLRPHAPPVGEPVPAPIYSRWRASDTSFGALGRGLLTMALAIGLLVGEPLARGLVLATVGFDVPGRGFVLLYATFAVPTGVYLIARIWTRARIA